MVIKELVHSDRVNQSLASIVLSAASSRKRDRCDAPESSCGSGSTNGGDDQDCSFFSRRSKKRCINSSLFSMPATTYAEGREDISDDDDELEDLALMYRTTVFREQRQLPESPYSTQLFKEEEDEDDGLSPSFVGSHPTILRAKTIHDNSSTDDIDPPEMSSRTHHPHEEGQDNSFIELHDETTSESYESRGGEESVSEREQPEWLTGSARPFVWTLPKKETEPLFSSVQREISKGK